MIVCVCRGVSERQVIEAVRCGARSVDDVARQCDGAGTDCGSCRTRLERHVVGAFGAEHGACFADDRAA